MRGIGRNIVRQKKNLKEVVYTAMEQKALETVGKVNLCCDGCELFRAAKKRLGEKKDVVDVSCFKDQNGAVKVSVDD